MIWWRVDREVSRRFSLGKYIVTLIFAAVLVPCISFIFSGARFYPTDISAGPFFGFTNIPSLGLLTGFVAWFFLLLSVPLFLLARKTGFIGFLPTMIAALVLILSKPIYDYSQYKGATKTDVFLGQDLFTGLTWLSFFAILYAAIVWFANAVMQPDE